MIYPLVRDLAGDETFPVPVAVTCRVLGFSKQAYFKWRANPVTDRDWNDAHLLNAAIDIHHDDPEFGYRFIADELEQQGVTASRNRVQRLCSLQKLFSVHARRRGAGRRPGPPVHDDLVRRKFTAEKLNALWLTDITEHPTAEGKLYLCAIKDACSNRIVGYSIDARMTADLAVRALQNALALRGRADVLEVVVHSDRGSQGGFNRSSQHLESEVRDGASAAEGAGQGARQGGGGPGRCAIAVGC
jgi:putative transposase